MISCFLFCSSLSAFCNPLFVALIIAFLKLLLRDYPNLVENLKNRYKVYNKTLKLIDKLEKQGQIFVFRPQDEIEIGTLARDQKELSDLYNQGLEETKERFEEFKKWVKKVSQDI